MSRARFLRFAAGTAASLLLAGRAAGRGIAAAIGAAGAGAAPGATPGAASGAAGGSMARRPIPASGELLPVIGLGTYRGFDVARGSDGYRQLAGVLQALFDVGGSVIDSSPMYGRAEAVTGELLAAGGARDRAFLATKVWTHGRQAGVAQMEESLRYLQARRLDLMQVHNLVDWRTHLTTLRAWKAEGRIRYLGVTHYTASAYDELEAVLRGEALDFLQINYSLDEPEAARRILPLAAARGLAVLVNRPFGGGSLLRRLRDRPLPPWAAEIGAASWAQVLLKFVLSHPAVTCAIPGTGRPEHMADNARAGIGPAPAAAFWQRHGREIAG